LSTLFFYTYSIQEIDVDKKDKPAGAGFFGTKELLKKYKKDTPGESVKEVYKDSGLGKWFGQSAGGEAGWDRYNTKGERVGKCGDSKPGEGKPKCLSPEKARKLRTQGGKKAIGNAAKRKKSQDPNTDRPGTGNKPINVSNNIKKEDRDMKSAKEFLNDIIEGIVNEDLLNEKNKPTDPAKWAASISAAKSKFDVYPSAYANAWASKHYKAAGGGWESTNEEVDLDEALKVSKNDGPFTVVAIKGGKVVDTFRGAEHGELKDVVAFSKANNKGAKISVEAKGGKIVHTESVDLGEAKKRITKLHGKYPKGTHYCATHVEHAEFGHGKPITSQHAAPDQLGNIEWYDVMFEHGIERGVATNEMEILLSEVHENHDHHDGVDIDEAKMIKVEVDPKKKIGYEVKSVGPGGKTTVTKRKDMPDTEDVGEAFDSKKSAEEIRIRTKYRMSKDGGKDGKPYSPEDMHGAMDSLQRKKARTNRVRRLGSQHPSNKNLNLKIGEAMGPGIAHKDGLKDAQNTASYKKYLDDVAVAKAKRDAQIKKEREDGTRSRYEDVEQVDELKQSTLRSYKDKAKKSERSGRDTGFEGETPSEREAGVRQVKKRVKGIDGATRRLVARQYQPEDVEQVDEMSAKAHFKTYQAKFIVPPIDRVRNPNREKEGLEGPYRSKKSGKVFYYDTKAGKYYDADSDIYLKVSDVMEAVEQVDELDIKTLKSYISKAQKDNTQRVTRMADKPDHMPVDKGEMKKLRKRQTGVVKAKTDIDMRKILGKNYRGRMGEEVEQVDELKMPEKSKRGRATDPVIAAALKRGWKRADLKADGKLRRGDAEGAESHMTNARKRKIASRVESVDLDEVSTDTLRSYVGKAKQNTDPNKRRNRMDGVSGALSRLDARSRLKRKADSSPEERAISKRLASEDVERIDELSPKTLKSYIWKAKGKVQSDLNTGNHSPETNKRAKNVVKAKGKLGEAKVGDTVHIGHASKGGTGVKGKVVKIDGNKVHIKNDKGDMFKGSMDRVTVGEAIKFDAGHPDSGISGTVSGKGKRNRKAGGEVRVKYKGHPAYKDDSPGLPIKAREIGRLIKTARKKDTKPHDSKNLTNPAVTRNRGVVRVSDFGTTGAGVRGGGVRKVRKEGAYAFATKVTDKFNKALDNKTKGFEKRVDDKLNKPAKTKLGKIGQKLFNSVEYTDEGAGADAILKYARENPGAFGNKKKSKSDTKRTSYRYIKDKKTGVTKLYTQGRDAKLTFVRDVQDHVEHGVDEGMTDSAKRAAKILTSRTPKNVHNPGNPKKPSRGDLEARQREDERLSRREGVEDMTAAQERDAQRRLKPTRATVAKVGLPSTDKERASYVKKHADEKGGKPGNTKARKLRDLKLRLRGKNQ
jgi:hypothetical protein